MEKTYMSQYGKLVKKCPGLHEYWYHGWLVARGSGLSGPNPDCAPTDKDWAFCRDCLIEFKKGYIASVGRQNAPYDQDVFEDMIFDFCADHAGDGDWIGEDGEYPEVFRDTIEYGPDDNEWSAYCRFANGVWVEMIGDADGFVRMEVD